MLKKSDNIFQNDQTKGVLDLIGVITLLRWPIGSMRKRITWLHSKHSEAWASLGTNPIFRSKVLQDEFDNLGNNLMFG